MTGRISFRVHGNPKGQPRPRAFSRGGVARVYDPGTAEGWKSEVAIAARPHIPAVPLTGALTLVLVFWIARPKSHFRTGKHATQLREDAPSRHTSKPDADNMAKALMDAMTTLGFWQDDAQIARLEVSKFYVSRVPGVDVTVSDAPDALRA